MAQPENVQFDRAGTGVSVAVAIAATLVASIGCSLADGGATAHFRLQRHQTLGGTQRRQPATMLTHRSSVGG